VLVECNILESFFFRRLVLALSPRRSGLNPRPILLGFMVAKMTLGQASLSKYFGFPLSIPFRQCSVLLHSSITDAI